MAVLPLIHRGENDRLFTSGLV